jgi:hypothetical protein
MTSLTDRYVAATLRGIPAHHRTEIENELRASIADAMESQTEFEALTALGDPSRLAADYSDRPNHLIGARYFPDYRRLLLLTLMTVIPVIFVVSGVSEFARGSAFGAALLGALSTAGVVAMHIAIWTTLVFAAIERRPRASHARRTPWSPLSLPDLPGSRIDLGSVVGGTSVVTLLASALILVQTVGPVIDSNGNVVGVIAPEVWSSGALLLIVFFTAAAIGLDIAGYYVGRGRAYAFANLAISAVFVACGVGIAWGGRLLNGAFFDDIGWPEGGGPNGVVTWGIIAIIILLSVTNVTGAFTKAGSAVREGR